MSRRLLSLAAAFGMLTLSLNPVIIATDRSCEECESHCSTIPMDPGDCIQLYCPGC